VRRLRRLKRGQSCARSHPSLSRLTGCAGRREEAATFTEAAPVGRRGMHMAILGTSAGDLCRRDVSVASRSMTLDEAARLMRGDHVGCLVVVEQGAGGRLVAGLLTDRDIVTTVVATGTPAGSLRVGDVMTDDVVCVRDDASPADILATMQNRHVRRLPVVGPQQNLLGIVTADDLLQWLATELARLARAVGEQVKVEAIVRP